MERKIEPGMRVFLRSDLKDGVVYGTDFWVEGMVKGEWVEVGDIHVDGSFSIKHIDCGKKSYLIHYYTPEMIDWDMMELEDMVDDIKEKQDLQKLVNEFNRVLEDLVDFIQDKHASNNEPMNPFFKLIKRAYKAMEDGLLRIEEIDYNNKEIIVTTNNDKRATLIPHSSEMDKFFFELYINSQEVKITDRETFEDIVENHTINQVTLKNGLILDRGEWNYIWTNLPVGSIFKILQDATVKIGR